MAISWANTLRGYRFLIFVLTFSSYAFFHATRKTLSNVKSSLSAEWTPEGDFKAYNTVVLSNYTWQRRHFFESHDGADLFLGSMDTAFMVAYAFGLYGSGFLGDRYSLKRVLSIGMIASAIVVYFLGSFTEFLHIYKKSVYIILIILNGFFQSVGWPTVIALMGNWFGKTSRGLILGLWSSCASVGNIIGALLTAAVLSYGYEYSFLLSSTLLLGLGVLNMFVLVDSPSELEPELYEYIVESNDAEGGCSNALENGEQAPLLRESNIQKRPVEKLKSISFGTAICLPGVVTCAVAYACLKLVNYSFFFWLPLYINRNWGLPESTADKLSVWYDIGGIIGGCVGGYISDRLGYRAIVVVPMMLISLPILYIFNVIANPARWVIMFLLTIAGFFIGGASNLISSAISVDLGQQKALKGNKMALSTVTGIIDGTGSIGAATGQIGLPFIEILCGWKKVFLMFIVVGGINILFMLPLIYGEYKEWRSGMYHENQEETPPSRDFSLPPPTYDEIS